MRMSIKSKLIISSLILGVIPVVCIGFISIIQFDSFAKETISQSYNGLEEQAYYILQSGVNEHIQKIDPAIKRVFQFTKNLANSPNIDAMINSEITAKKNAKKSGENHLKSLLKTCMTHYALIKKQVDLAYYSLEYIIKNTGQIYTTNCCRQNKWNVFDYQTNNYKIYNLPEFTIGAEPIYKYYDLKEDYCPIVDDIYEMTGVYSSIFQKADDGRFIRIATNIPDSDGKRAIETMLQQKTKYGKPNPVISEIVQGKKYQGIAYEVNGNYVSIYKPVVTNTGDVLGSFFVGIPSHDNSIIESIKESKIKGLSTSFVLNPEGEILIHSKSMQEGKNIFINNKFKHLKKIFKQPDKTKGSIHSHFVTYNNQFHYITYSFLPERNWFVCVDSQLDSYLDDEIEKSKNMIIKEFQNIYSSSFVKINDKNIPTINNILFFDQNAKKIISFPDNIPTYNNQNLIKDSLWFKRAAKTSLGEVFISDINISNYSEKAEMLISSPVYYNGEFKGIIAVIYDWDLMQKILKEKEYGKTGFAFIIDNNGFIVSHPDFSLKNPVQISEKKFGKLSEETISKIYNGESGFANYTFKGIKHYLYHTKLFIGNLQYSFAAIIPIDEFLFMANKIKMFAENKFNIIVRTIFISLIVWVCVAIAIGIFTSRSISNPVISVIDFAKTVSEGDLSIMMQENRKDEIGILTGAINSMVQSFRNIVSDVIANASSLSKSAENMLNIAEIMTDTTEQMSNQTKIVAEASKKMTTNVNSIASAIEYMSNNINSITDSTSKMSESMTFVSKFVEQMSFSMKNIGDNAKKGAYISEEAVNKSNMASNTIKKLGESAEKISGITTLIKHISVRTKTLAINASIEASTAGDSGDGFSVISSDIKKFADQSAHASNEIATNISNVEKNIIQAIEAIENVTSINNEMNQSSQKITLAVDKQTKRSDEIVNHIKQTRSNASNIANEMNELNVGIENIVHNAGNAASGSGEITENIQGLNVAAMHINESAIQVSKSAAELDRLSGDLQKLVEIFNYKNMN